MADSDFRWSHFDPFLRAPALGDKPYTGKIVRVSVQEVYDRNLKKIVPKPAISIAGLSQWFILSPVNRKTLQGAFGDQAQSCVGQTITLKTETVKAFGQERSVIRISVGGRETAPSAATTSTKPAPRVAPPVAYNAQGQMISDDGPDDGWEDGPSLDDAFVGGGTIHPDKLATEQRKQKLPAEETKVSQAIAIVPPKETAPVVPPTPQPLPASPAVTKMSARPYSPKDLVEKLHITASKNSVPGPPSPKLKNETVQKLNALFGASIQTAVHHIFETEFENLTGAQALALRAWADKEPKLAQLEARALLELLANKSLE